MKSVRDGDSGAEIVTLTEAELKTTLEFCARAYIPVESDDEDEISKAKVNLVGVMAMSETLDALSKAAIDGRRIRLDRGALGLERC